MKKKTFFLRGDFSPGGRCFENPMTDQYHVVTAHEPAPVVNNMEDISAKIDLSCITQPPEEDKRKLTFILGDIKITMEDGPVKVPEKMLGK